MKWLHLPMNSLTWCDWLKEQWIHMAFWNWNFRFQESGNFLIRQGIPNWRSDSYSNAGEDRSLIYVLSQKIWIFNCQLIIKETQNTVHLYDIICHFLHLLHSTWGQLAEWATLIWQMKPTGSGNWQQRWRWSSHYILLWRNRAVAAQL